MRLNECPTSPDVLVVEGVVVELTEALEVMVIYDVGVVVWVVVDVELDVGVVVVVVLDVVFDVLDVVFDLPGVVLDVPEDVLITEI